MRNQPPASSIYAHKPGWFQNRNFGHPNAQKKYQVKQAKKISIRCFAGTASLLHVINAL